MAVRNDFTAGEVLAAADLNDTFASKLPYSYGTATPSTTDSGFLWYDSNSTPAAPKFWDGSAFQDFPAGLAHIATESFSAVSSVSVNGCFTSAHANYRIVLEVGSSATGSLSVRLRASGSDNSSAVYDRSGVYNNGSSAAAWAIENGTSWDFATTNLLTRWMTFDIMAPQIAAATKVNGTRAETSGSAMATSVFGAVHTDGSAFDGFSIFPASGTITGTVRVYGYKD